MLQKVVAAAAAGSDESTETSDDDEVRDQSDQLTIRCVVSQTKDLMKFFNDFCSRRQQKSNLTSQTPLCPQIQPLSTATTVKTAMTMMMMMKQRRV